MTLKSPTWVQAHLTCSSGGTVTEVFCHTAAKVSHMTQPLPCLSPAPWRSWQPVLFSGSQVPHFMAYRALCGWTQSSPCQPLSPLPPAGPGPWLTVLLQAQGARLSHQSALSPENTILLSLGHRFSNTLVLAPKEFFFKQITFYQYCWKLKAFKKKKSNSLKQ